MARIIKNSLGNFFVILIIFSLVTGWMFSGFPRIWQDPSIPPEVQEAQANTTGEKYPTLGETISEAPWSDNSWTTPTNIYADDAATANVTAASYDSPDQTFVLKATGFDFSAIPDNSTINGVTVRVNSWYRSGQGSGSMDLCQLLNTSKAKVGTNNCSTAVPLTTTNTTIITKGGATDTWGNALTAAWVKNANFGVAIGILATAANADVDVDYVTIEIDYTPPAATISILRTDAQGTIAYGNVDLSGSTSTDPAGQNKTTTFQNDGTAAEKFSIMTGNAIGGTGWTAVATTPGVNEFRHSFATTSPVINWQVMGIDPSYQIASSSVAALDTLNIYLKIEMPSVSDYVAKDITVTVFAEAAP